MVKPKNKIGLFLTYLYSLNLVTFQPTYILVKKWHYPQASRPIFKHVSYFD
jgi:hypothetical protein